MTSSANGHGELTELREHTRVMLQPIAAPSILGLFGFAGATFIVAAHLAGWYGTEESPAFLFPFAAMFGGLAQFLAGMWAFKARDGVATAMHGMWGSFWLAYGILNLLVAAGVYGIPAGSFPELGFWFLVLAVITGLGAIAALAESLALVSVLTTLAVGAGFLAVHYLTAVGWWETAGGWILVGSAVAATYTAGAMMLEGAWAASSCPSASPRSRPTSPAPGSPSRSSSSTPSRACAWASSEARARRGAAEARRLGGAGPPPPGRAAAATRRGPRSARGRASGVSRPTSPLPEPAGGYSRGCGSHLQPVLSNRSRPPTSQLNAEEGADRHA